MQIQDELQKLMQKDMDRKSFLKHVGIGFAAIAGVNTILKTVASLNQPQGQTKGYGSSAYGGHRHNATAQQSVKNG